MTLAIKNIFRDHFLQKLQQNTVAIVANNRLKNSLKQEYKNLQTKLAFVNPQIFNLLEFCYQKFEIAVFKGFIRPELLPDKILTSLEQEIIFTKIIKQSEKNPLLSCQEIAKQAVDATNLMQDYMVKFSNLNNCFKSFELERFLVWHSKYKKFCQQNNFLDPTGFLKIFVENLAKIQLPDRVLIAGFDKPTPLQQQIFIKFKVLKLTESPQCITKTKIVCNSFEDEITAVAKWSKTKISQNCKVGVIVPELEKHFLMVKNIFKEVLYPEQSDLDLSNYQPVHNFSLGQPLLNYELINVAITWLEVLHQKTPIDYQIISKLLVSPHWGQQENDIGTRSEFDWIFREQTKSHLSKNKFLRILLNNNFEAIWHQKLIMCCEQSQNLPKKNLVDWSQYFISLWQELGIGKFSNTAITAQWLNGLEQALTTMNQMLPVIGMTDVNFAIQTLKKITSQQIFQFNTRINAPIQIMGLLEANNLEFDEVWLLQVNNNIFPASPKPNSILPLDLQKSLEMPRSSPEQELVFATNIIEKLTNSTKAISFSYSEMDLDGVKLFASGIINDIPETKNQLQKISFSKPQLEQFSETKGLQLSTPCKLKNATRFFRAQTICPLMAYVEFRLGAVELPTPAEDFSPLARGNLIHQIMYKLMSDLSQDRLALIEAEINTFAKLNQINPNVSKLEITRVNNIISDWLNEFEEKDGVEIFALEQQLEINFHKLNFTIRIDRVDDIAGNKLIIDYKTGAVKKTGWFDDRLTEPQLPLYAVTSADNICGIAFASLKPSENKFLVESYCVPAKKPTKTNEEWQALLDSWHQKLQILAEEIINGDAHYLPHNTNSPAVGFCQIYAP